MAKLWQGASGALGLHADIEAFLSSLSVDVKLLKEDIECSIAHARMLGKQGILRPEVSEALCGALEAMAEEAASGGASSGASSGVSGDAPGIALGALKVDPESEDVHSFIEAELTRRLGDTGKAVHAGRSRNDQVAVAFRLYILRAFDAASRALLDALQAILDLAEGHRDSLMPGYTHLQRAQSVTLAHHLLAWCAALERDYSRLRDGRARADECPLGSGALAGSGLPTDREYTAALLGFARPSRNTMDAVADRDACVDFASACASIMAHLSRACEDIILWVSAEYRFMRLSDAASTGSSIMPQKRNPDVAELVRGKAARVFGTLQAFLVLQKGLPYAYNRDLQEDKELFFDAEKTLLSSLRAFAILVGSLEPDTARMRKAAGEGFLEAADVAEYLVQGGLPFRNAYQAAKALVELSLAAGKSFSELSAKEIAGCHEAFAAPGFDSRALVAYLDPFASLARRKQTGGPSPERCGEEIKRLKTFVAAEREALQSAALQRAALSRAALVRANPRPSVSPPAPSAAETP